MRRFPWILTILSAVLFAVLVSLGVWQVQRLQWKEGLIAKAERAAALPRVPLREAFRGDAGLDFRKVRVVCPGLASAPYLELRAIENGEPGVRLISACRNDEHFSFPFLIDRGFVADAISARPPVQPSNAPVAIDGELREIPAPGLLAQRPVGRTHFVLEPWGMAEALGENPPAAPVIIFATTSSNPEWLALKPSAPPAAFSNNHLGYAITWFGLALALVGFYIALLRRALAPPRPDGETSGKETDS